MASTDIDLYVDETYLALFSDEPLPVSDEKYAYELTLQEAIFSSSSVATKIYRDESALWVEDHVNNFPTSWKSKKSKSLGESSRSKNILCGICMESKKDYDIFSGLLHCSHTFCVDCVTKYVASKIKDNISLVECPYPKCDSKIEPENCYDILPREIYSRWENALCEALILGSEKFYCPYKECSALMVKDVTGETLTQAECPNCRKLFCAKCRVKWHVGFTCVEYEGLREDERGSDDLLVMNLAKDKQWRRCGNCGFYLEKSEGCLHMTCRCHYEFCYQCGNKWSGCHTC